jgi:hypothetical protein
MLNVPLPPFSLCHLPFAICRCVPDGRPSPSSIIHHPSNAPPPYNPQGIAPLSPRVARNELPWVTPRPSWLPLPARNERGEGRYTPITLAPAHQDPYNQIHERLPRKSSALGLHAMKAKNIILVAVILPLGICLFVAGVVVGALRAHKVAQREETQFVLPTSYRTSVARHRSGRIQAAQHRFVMNIRKEQM